LTVDHTILRPTVSKCHLPPPTFLTLPCSGATHPHIQPEPEIQGDWGEFVDQLNVNLGRQSCPIFQTHTMHTQNAGLPTYQQGHDRVFLACNSYGMEQWCSIW